MLKSRPATPVFAESKDPRVLAINHSDIDCNAELTRNTAFKFTVIDPLCTGFGSAPFCKNKKDKKDPHAKKYSEIDRRGLQRVLRMWPYEKTSVLGDKGPRVERPFEIACGNVITLFLDPNFRGKQNPLPPNVASIPIFTLCEVTVAPKNSDAGSSFKITAVRPVTYTLHSFFTVLPHFPVSLQDARVSQNDHVVAFPPMAKDLETKNVSFVVRIPSSAIVSGFNSDLRIYGWGSDQMILIPGDVARKYTNTNSIEGAEGMLDCAIACDSLFVMVFSNEFWATSDGTVFKGIPLVDTEHLLEDAEPGLEFETKYTATLNKKNYKVVMSVASEPVGVHDGQPMLSSDFVLAGPEIDLPHAYAFSIDFVGDETIKGVFSGYINAARDENAHPHKKRFRSMI